MIIGVKGKCALILIFQVMPRQEMTSYLRGLVHEFPRPLKFFSLRMVLIDFLNFLSAYKISSSVREIHEPFSTFSSFTSRTNETYLIDDHRYTHATWGREISAHILFHQKGSARGGPIPISYGNGPGLFKPIYQIQSTTTEAQRSISLLH